ncbi:MAG: hypothetical protein R2704_17630 [Microthrixaceae bacterium]
MNLHLLRDSNTWMRARAAGVIALVAGLVGEWVAGGDGSTNDRQSTNLSGVTWDGALAADGTMTVEVRYQFLPAAFELDPDMPNAVGGSRRRHPPAAERANGRGRKLRGSGAGGHRRPGEHDHLRGARCGATGRRRGGDRPAGGLPPGLGAGQLRLRRPGGHASHTGGYDVVRHRPHPRSAGRHDRPRNDSNDNERRGEGTIGFGGQVSTYDEAAVVAVLPADVAPDVPEDGSADGRSATELFDQAVTERSPGRVPDGAPESGFRVNWRVVGLCVGIVVAMALSWMLGLFLRNRRRRT